MKGYAVVDLETTGLDPFQDYVIEIGIVFTDNELNVLKTYSTLVLDPNLQNEIANGWPEKYANAYKVHGISSAELLKHGIKPEEVMTEIEHIVLELYDKDKPMLVSDCLNFEWSFLLNMWHRLGVIWRERHAFPFHYCGRDINILLDLGILKREHKHTHRALEDAIAVYSLLWEARSIIMRLRGESNENSLCNSCN